MKLSEIELIANLRIKAIQDLKQKIDKSIELLTDAGYSKEQSYKMLANKQDFDYRTLKRWHKGDTKIVNKKLFKLLEE
jgi:ribonuclease HI